MVYIYGLLGRLVLLPLLLWLLRRGISPKCYRAVRLFLLVELGLSTVALALHNHVTHLWMSYAMSAFLYFFFSLGYATVTLWALYLLQRLWTGRCAQSSPHTLRYPLLLSCLVFVGTMVLGWYSVYYPKVTFRSLSLNEHKAEEERRELRLVLLTDIHIGEGITIGYIERMVAQVEALKPDVVLVGGDYIDYYSHHAYQPEVMAQMRRLSQLAPHGVYYVLGNHEYRGDAFRNFEFPASVGGVLLLDSIAYPADGSYAIIGRDDYIHKERKGLDEMLAELEERELTILLEHTPEGLDQLEGSPIDLALYGHTHGGQLFPNHLTVWLKYGITSGVDMRGSTELYVSSGVGSAGAPYRIGTRSEIVVYDIRY